MTRKQIETIAAQMCDDPQHLPPTNALPGKYEHRCPGCGFTKQFTVKEPKS